MYFIRERVRGREGGRGRETEREINPSMHSLLTLIMCEQYYFDSVRVMCNLLTAFGKQYPACYVLYYSVCSILLCPSVWPERTQMEAHSVSAAPHTIHTRGSLGDTDRLNQ